MAKRIKVKGKNPPRGLSKAKRMVRGQAQKWNAEMRRLSRDDGGGSVIDPFDAHIANYLDPEDVVMDKPGFKRGQTAPSSTRKKRVKEGSRKFIGPRQMKTEVAEDADARRLEMIIDRMEELGLPKDMEMARSNALFTKFLGQIDRPVRLSLRGKEARRPRGGEIEDVEEANTMSPNLRRRLYEFLSRKADRG